MLAWLVLLPVLNKWVQDARWYFRFGTDQSDICEQFVRFPMFMWQPGLSQQLRAWHQGEMSAVSIWSIASHPVELVPYISDYSIITVQLYLIWHTTLLLFIHIFSIFNYIAEHSRAVRPLKATETSEPHMNHHNYFSSWHNFDKFTNIQNLNRKCKTSFGAKS